MSLPIRKTDLEQPAIDFRFQKPLGQISKEERVILDNAVENFYKKHAKHVPDHINSDELKYFNDKNMHFNLEIQKRKTGEKCTLLIEDRLLKLYIRPPSENEPPRDFWENCDTCVLVAKRMLCLNPPEIQEQKTQQ